ncbi:hypothetical protein CYY_005347 [Polysphondylium violaceum]|uniref:Ribonuclease P/MRP protein subunit POP5 n=1 Tax=Polysphondylium violaceum TaxID=133409 RepID=A0A8J4PWS5_9MYCE|nr:hypothetical protein CYY_005347 [Polysphondylium violaceum]
MVRLKNRYLMTEVIWHDPSNASALSELWLFHFLIDESKRLFGELTTEAFKKTVKFVYLNPDTNLFIIRCSFTYYKSLWSVLSMITSYNNIPVYFRVIHLSGSIRGCQKAALKVFQKQIFIYDKNTIQQQQQTSTSSLLSITQSDIEMDNAPSEDDDIEMKS